MKIEHKLTVNHFEAGFSLFHVKNGDSCHFGPCTYAGDTKWELSVPQSIVTCYWTTYHWDDDPEPLGAYTTLPYQEFFAKYGITESAESSES